MTPAQQEALRRVAAATEPVAVPAATARILSERYGYITAEGGGWTLTPRGRAHLAHERAEQRHRDVEKQIPIESRKWAERVEAWLKAHGRLRESQYAAWRHARHVAACDHAGIEPVLIYDWPEESRIWVEEAVRAAADCLKDFDAAIDLANERDVGVIVSYEANEKVPKSRRDAARAAATGGAVVSLRTYRERRPTRPGAA